MSETNLPYQQTNMHKPQYGGLTKRRTGLENGMENGMENGTENGKDVLNRY